MTPTRCQRTDFEPAFDRVVAAVIGPLWYRGRTPTGSGPRRQLRRSGEPQCASPAGQARVLHEVLVRGKGLASLARRIPHISSILTQRPALRAIVQVREHDLVEHLVVYSRIRDR